LILLEYYLNLDLVSKET